MSAEKPQSELFDTKCEATFASWSIDELRDEVQSLYKNYPDTSSSSRQELVEILTGERHITDLTIQKPPKIEPVKEPTPEEVASEYFSVFGTKPALSLGTVGQKEALKNVENHKYELWVEDQEEKRNAIKKFHHA